MWAIHMALLQAEFLPKFKSMLTWKAMLAGKHTASKMYKESCVLGIRPSPPPQVDWLVKRVVELYSVGVRSQDKKILCQELDCKRLVTACIPHLLHMEHRGCSHAATSPPPGGFCPH